MAESTATNPETQDFSETEIAVSKKEPSTPASIRKLTNAVVQHMQDAGIIANDDQRGALLMAKRLNHALFANENLEGLAEARKAFADAVVATNGDFSKLTTSGTESAVFKLVDAYLTARTKHFEKSVSELDELPQALGSMEYAAVRERAIRKRDQYRGELEAYKRWPQIVNDVAAKYPKIFTVGKYQRLGDLAINTGIIEGNPEILQDNIDDVMSEVAAKRLLDTALVVMTTPRDALMRQKEFSAEYKTNIIVKSEDVALHTIGIERLNVFTPEGGAEVEQMQALSNLLGAHLNALTSHNRNFDGTTNPPIGELANNQTQIPGMVRAYQSAVLSLAYHNIRSGPSAEDTKMKKLAEDLKMLMEQRNIVLEMSPADAAKSARSMANESADYLKMKFAGRPDLIAKVDTLLAQAIGPKAEKGFADKLPQPTATFAADTVNKPQAGMAVGV